MTWLLLSHQTIQLLMGDICRNLKLYDITTIMNNFINELFKLKGKIEMGISPHQCTGVILYILLTTRTGGGGGGGVEH